MSDPFLSSDAYDERAHRLYIEGRYDEAVELLREGIDRFPFAVDLQVGMAYVRFAREEYAWARHSFEKALTLEPESEDALAGLGETLLKFGDQHGANRCFDMILTLGYREDHDLILQIGRALFREGAVADARRYFEIVVEAHTDSSEGAACLGYALHRLGEDNVAVRWLRHALQLDEDHVEARVYLGNVLYDRGEYDAALYHFDRTAPGDHVEDLAVWRVIELKKSMYRLGSEDPEMRPWVDRLRELASEMGPEDRLLAEVEATLPDGSIRDPRQLDFFGTMLSELDGMKRRLPAETHKVTMQDGATYGGTWEEIVLQMLRDDRDWAGGSLAQYMEAVARKSTFKTGVAVPATDAESFIRGIAAAGLLKISR